MYGKAGKSMEQIDHYAPAVHKSNDSEKDSDKPLIYMDTLTDFDER